MGSVVKTPTGLAYFCFAHDQGCLIKNIQNESDTPGTINHVCAGAHNCDWECIGKFRLFEDIPRINKYYYFENVMETEFWDEKEWKNVVFDLTDF
jgi:hypothetical protein